MPRRVLTGSVQGDRGVCCRLAGQTGDRALKCSGRLVRQIRDGLQSPPDQLGMADRTCNPLPPSACIALEPLSRANQ